MELIGQQISGKTPRSHLSLILLSALLYVCLPLLLSSTTVKCATIKRLEEGGLPTGHESVSTSEDEEEQGEQHNSRGRRAVGAPMDLGGAGRFNPMYQNPMRGQYEPKYPIYVDQPNDGIVKNGYYISKQTEVRDYLGLAPLPPLHANEFSTGPVRGNPNRQFRQQQYPQYQPRPANNQQFQQRPIHMPGFGAGRVNLNNIQPQRLTEKQRQIVLYHAQQQGNPNPQQLQQQRERPPMMRNEEQVRDALGLDRLPPDMYYVYRPVQNRNQGYYG